MIALTRTYLSMNLIQSAALFAGKSSGVERDAGADPSEAQKREHRAYVLAAVFCSVAFLEGTANEFFSDAADSTGERLKPLGSDVLASLAESWNNGESKTEEYPVLEKYDTALFLADKPPFDHGRAPYQDVKLLIKLRNRLIHYKPEWIRVGAKLRQCEEHEVERWLKRKFPVNPLTPPGSAFFPHKVLGHGCAEWAVNQSVSFVDLFFARLQIAPPYSHLRDTLG